MHVVVIELIAAFASIIVLGKELPVHCVDLAADEDTCEGEVMVVGGNQVVVGISGLGFLVILEVGETSGDSYL